MRTSVLLPIIGLAQAYDLGGGDAWYSNWAPPSSDDVRGPCPMLNSLANHGFLPHTGKGITHNDTVNTLSDVLNIDSELGEFLFNSAVSTNLAPNATTFSLSDLSNHDILEHDASLSRADAYWGDDHTFNETVYDQTKSYWTADPITVQMAANARLARVIDSNKTNPEFSLSQLGTAFGFGESAAYILVLGDRVHGEVPRSWIEYLFETERLPVELGWKKQEQVIMFDDLSNMFDRVVNATGTSPDVAARLRARGGLHIGPGRKH